jgi:hypothetical protein
LTANDHDKTGNADHNDKPGEDHTVFAIQSECKAALAQVSNYHQCRPYQRDDIQESIHDGDQDNYSAKPNMDSIVFRHNASLPILSVIEKAERILAEEECCEQEAKNLVI